MWSTVQAQNPACGSAHAEAGAGFRCGHTASEVAWYHFAWPHAALQYQLASAFRLDRTVVHGRNRTAVDALRSRSRFREARLVAPATHTQCCRMVLPRGFGRFTRSSGARGDDTGGFLPSIDERQSALSADRAKPCSGLSRTPWRCLLTTLSSKIAWHVQCHAPPTSWTRTRRPERLRGTLKRPAGGLKPTRKRYRPAQPSVESAKNSRGSVAWSIPSYDTTEV